MGRVSMRKQKILVVDDSDMNRLMLEEMLGDEYDIIEAEDGVQAISVLQRQGDEIAVVLLDIVMPRMDGFGVLKVMNQNNWIETIPVIMVSAESGTTQVEKAYEMGVVDFIMRPFDMLIVRRRVVNTILLYAKQKRLIDMVEDQIYEKEKRSSLMIDILSHIVEFRNGESGLHILNVRTLTNFLLWQLVQMSDEYNLSKEEISIISTASALHDIGKIAISSKILNKPGRLTDEEFAIMKGHALAGARMLESLQFYQDDPLVKYAYEICRWHHERYDGRGYPDGLVGDAIPISAQAVALADVYDALTSERVYKKAIPPETAVQMILNGECGAFSPLLLKCLSDNAEKIRKEVQEKAILQENTREPHSLGGQGFSLERVGMSERTRRLLDYERTKYEFFVSTTEEIQFEVTASPPMVILSKWGAGKLGLDETTTDPANDEKINEVFGEGTWARMAKSLHNTTPESPEIVFECKLHYLGEDHWYRIFARAIWSSDDPPQYEGALGKAVDIHETRMRLEELERKASRDSLTGLLNHASAREWIRERLDKKVDGNFALAIFDLDWFKSANDNYGHSFGDSVLKHVAEILKHSTRGADIPSRIGGDEFLLFLDCTVDPERIIDRIFNTLNCEFENYTISISMGVAKTSDVGRDYEALFRAADQALYSVKRAGRGRYAFYSDSMKDIFIAASELGDRMES